MPAFKLIPRTWIQLILPALIDGLYIMQYNLVHAPFIYCYSVIIHLVIVFHSFLQYLHSVSVTHIAWVCIDIWVWVDLLCTNGRGVVLPGLSIVFYMYLPPYRPRPIWTSWKWGTHNLFIIYHFYHRYSVMKLAIHPVICHWEEIEMIGRFAFSLGRFIGLRELVFTILFVGDLHTVKCK